MTRSGIGTARCVLEGVAADSERKDETPTISGRKGRQYRREILKIGALPEKSNGGPVHAGTGL